LTSIDRASDVIGGDESTLLGDPRWIAAQKAVRSQNLARATQLRAILLFIVRHAILQPEEPIPEFEIGYRVLGRRKDFNPLDDNIVRVQMGHLRKKLEQYFSTEGSTDEVVIFIPNGRYTPSFSTRAEFTNGAHPAREVLPTPADSAVSEDEDAAVLPIAESPVIQDGPKRASLPGALLNGRRIAVSLLFLALAVACIALWRQNRSLQRSVDAFDQPLAAVRDKPTVAAFWTDFLGSSQLTDVVTGDVAFSLCQRFTGKVFPLEDYVTRDYNAQLRVPGMSPDLHNTLMVISRLDITNSSELSMMRRILALDPEGHRIHYYKAQNFVADLFARDNVILLGNGLSNPWEQPFRDSMNFVANVDKFNSRS
jgi:hypothetical protein